MNQILNSQLENALRILIILHTSGKELSFDQIKNCDLISTYSKEYGLGDENLNGDNSYAVFEVTAKYRQIKDGIKHLVVQGLATTIQSEKGFLYRISAKRIDLYNSMDSDYKDDYSQNCMVVLRYIDEVGDKEIRKLIYKKSLRRDINE